jgi:cell division protease FtsH
VKSSSQSNFVYLLILIAIVAMIFFNINRDGQQGEFTINELASQLKQGNVAKIVEDENTLTITLRNSGGERTSTKENGSTFVEQMLHYGVTTEDLDSSKVTIEVAKPSPWVNLLTFIGYILPFIIVGAAFFMIFRQAQGSNNAAISFGKSRARMFHGDQPKVTFADVAGVDEAKEELQEVVEFLKTPQKFVSLGARILCWQKLFLVKRVFRFSRFLVQNSLRCLLALAPAEYATYLNRLKRIPLALYLLMKLMR